MLGGREIQPLLGDWRNRGGKSMSKPWKVVVHGGGFDGLSAVKSLNRGASLFNGSAAPDCSFEQEVSSATQHSRSHSHASKLIRRKVETCK